MPRGEAGKGLAKMRAALERESKRTLETPSPGLSSVTGDQAKVRARTVQSNGARLWMIQNVGCVDSNLKLLGFRKAECLAHIRIKSPNASLFDKVLSESAAFSRLRSLENDLSRAAIGVSKRYRIQRAVRVVLVEQVVTLRVNNISDLAALRIVNADVGVRTSKVSTPVEGT